MALGTPTHVGAAYAATATAAQTVSGVTAAIGDLIYVAVTDDGSGSTYAVTDSAGNTYTRLGTAMQSANNYNLHRFFSVLTAALVAGTVTSTKSGGTAGTWDRHVTVEKLTGTGLTLDKSAQATGASSTAWSSGASAVTTAAAEAVIGAAADGGANTNSTPGGSATELYDSQPAGNVSTFADITTTYKIVAATGAQTASGTWSNADVWAACVDTFMESGGASPQTVSPSGIASAEAFGNATISTGNTNVSPSGIASAEAWGVATINPGGTSVSPTGIASAEAWGNPTINAGGTTVSPSGIASAEAWGTAVLTHTDQTVSPTGIPSGEAWGNAVLTGGAVGSGFPPQLPSTGAGT